MKKLIILLLFLTACTPAYHTTVQIEGEPKAEEREPEADGMPLTVTALAPGPPSKDERSLSTVISQATHFAVRASNKSILEGWIIIFREGKSFTHCKTKTVYINSETNRWRDHLAHELTHAVLCKASPDNSEEDDHEWMRQEGLCYGGCP